MECREINKAAIKLPLTKFLDNGPERVSIFRSYLIDKPRLRRLLLVNEILSPCTSPSPVGCTEMNHRLWFPSLELCSTLLSRGLIRCRESAVLASFVVIMWP